MRHALNRPRSHRKQAAWDAEQLRRERTGIAVAGFIQPASRSLSLRATSFKEAQPGRSELPKVKQTVAKTKRAKAVLALARSGDPLLMSIAKLSDS